MPASLCGTWDIISNVNLEGYMIALGNPCLRKVALKLKLRKVIEQKGDQYIIKTSSTFRNYTVPFRVGQEFPEFTKGDCRCFLDCSLVAWEGNKLVCEQTGEKKNRGWAHWIEEDKLHLELYCEGEVCKQIFKKKVNE
uniref:Cellular retinoic acid-binding protein 1 n=1 Tax=Dicentrarchus labrax TaxID=13489 RepID=A0A8C4ICS2_DICLA